MRVILGSNLGPPKPKPGQAVNEDEIPPIADTDRPNFYLLLRLLSIAEMRNPDGGAHEPVYYDNLSYKALRVLEVALTLEWDKDLPRRRFAKYQMMSDKLRVRGCVPCVI